MIVSLLTVGLCTPTFADRPNVILILADDLGAHDLGCTGSTFYETPHLDRLAREGMNFTRAYAACPVCSPTRAALMTGRYPPRTGVTNYIGGERPGKFLPAEYARQLALDEWTVAEAFAEAGYKTGIAGKWHLGAYKNFGPAKQGFAEVGPGDPQGLNQKLDRADQVAAFAEKFIRAHAAEPFFLYLPHNQVHVPLLAKPDMKSKYERKVAGLASPPNDAKDFRPEGQKRDRRIQNHAAYAAMMEDLDDSVGRVLKTLDDLKIAERTIVVFTSDNGGLSTAEGSPTSNAPLRAGKGWLYEGGIRVPLLVRWPAWVKAGSTSEVRTVTCDLMPTLLEAGGIVQKPERHCDGLSLLPTLIGDDERPKFFARPLFWHYPHYSNQGGGPGSAVIVGDRKLIHTYDDDRMEAFDLTADPNETKDIAASNAAMTASLRARLDAWRNSVGAKTPRAK